MSEMSNTKLICELCGKEFLCGAKCGKCWCFEIDLKEETLSKLQTEFESCLCKDCLKSRELPK
jgi:Cysteine-rich CWC